MSDKQKQPRAFHRIKTGKLERRFSLAKAGLIAGTKLATLSATNTLFSKKEDKEKNQKAILSKQAQYLTEEIGKLKGSVVKVGQMLALWGEHFLPEEVTDALHALEDDTTALAWPTIEQVLRERLGERTLLELNIDPTPIGSASLGQVHRATIKSTGEQICLKIQYPGVAEAIDSDLDAIHQILKFSRLVPVTEELKAWLDEVRAMMKREVDYTLELASTERFKERLAADSRFIVPKVYPAYSGPKILATSYEPGERLNSETCISLPAERRNKIAAACLDLCWREVFLWGEMQTDPNFGNYFIRLSTGDTTNTEEIEDKVVLLDFGAVRAFPPHVLEPGKHLIKGAYLKEVELVKQAMLKLDFVPDTTPNKVFASFAKLCFLAMEPFHPHKTATASDDSQAFPQQPYDWERSDLINRIMLQATKSALSRYFSVPPKEFMFLSRKIIGAYTLMTILKATIDGQAILHNYIKE